MISSNLTHRRHTSFEDDNDKERVIHLKGDYTKIMISDEADEVIKKLFDSLKNRYQNSLQVMRGGEFIFDFVQLMYGKCHEKNLNCGGSCKDFPDWAKKQNSSNKLKR